MSDQWKYQLRIFLGDELAEVARRDPGDGAIKPLTGILGKHRATMKCQLDAFADYVAEAEAQGTEKYPLYEWTRATIEDPAKKAKYTKSFTLYVDGDEVYAKEKADALEVGPTAPGGRVDPSPVQTRYQSRQQPTAAAELPQVSDRRGRSPRGVR